MGTPKTLQEAMENALKEHQATAAASARAVTWHIRDFMAQKFTVAMYKAKSDAERKRLMELYQVLTSQG